MLTALALSAHLLLGSVPGDVDTDGDGISDFHEVHKHRTDPSAADSDRDGIPDGDWNERREFTYTVRRLLHVLPPVTPDVLCDDYQDARILDETPGYVELEVIHYPLNSVASAIVADPDWRETARGMAEWTRPGLTANWDDAMRDRLIADLREAGIDALALDDRTLVERATPWLLDHARCVDGFTTFCSRFVDGKVEVHPAHRDRGDGAADPQAIEEAWQRELFAKGMYENGQRGTCTSTAIYLNGCLRALGIPTRIVLTVPAIDTSDEREAHMLRALGNHAVRSTIEEATESLGHSWTSHTFNEVFVGGRWRRLNFDRLGQNILDPQYLGLMTHVATFGDWADGDMASTWGARQARSPRDDAFGGSNPYSTAALSDRFGAHATIDNPPAPGEFAERVIDRAWWFEERPAGVDMRLDDPDTAGHVVVHVEGSADTPRRLYRDFYEAVGKAFALKADGQDDVPLRATRGYWVAPDRGLQHFYLRIEPADFARMAPGIAYHLVALPTDAHRRFTVREGVTLTRGGPSGPIADRDGAAAPAGDEAGLRELHLTGAAWSDRPDSPVGAIPGLGTVLLVRMGPSADFDSHKRFTEVADRRFYLQAPNEPTLSVAAAVGGITTDDGSYLAIEFGPADWRDLRAGVPYTLTPRNENGTHRWMVDSSMRVVR